VAKVTSKPSAFKAPAPSIRRIAESTQRLDNYLDVLTKAQQLRMAAAIKRLEARILMLADDLEREKGRLVSTRANFRQAQALHAQLGNLMERYYIVPVAKMMDRDMGRITKRVQKYLGTVTGEAQKFVGVDRVYINQLRKLNVGEVSALGEVSVERVARKMYEHLLGGAEFNSLKREIANVFTGRKDVRGRPMSTYSRQMAFDNVRNFQSQVTTYKAKEIGLDTFIYYGDIIKNSRSWCIRHAGKVFSRKQIDILSQQNWDGKSGPWFTNRGGYQCRHWWVPIRKESVAGEKGAIEVQNYFAEQ
jgi:hypothetical protein